jgi:RNA-binding protein
MPSSPLRTRLRAHGHALKAVIMVGKHGVTGALRKELQQAAFAHELVKVKIASECPLDRFEVALRLEGEPGVRIVQILGRVILVYKRHPQEPKFEGKREAKPEGKREAKREAKPEAKRGKRSRPATRSA